MSHELRTPLNAIIGFSQILINKTKGPLTQYQEDMLGRVLSNGKNLLELINDILAFSRIEAGRLELDPIPFELPELVRATVEELRSLAAQKAIELTVEIDLDDPNIINDAVRVRQIVVNLLSNAIKFTAQGSVLVKVEDGPSTIAETACNQDTDGQNSDSRPRPSQNIIISVTDTGCGISALDQVYIFDAFHQSDQKVTRKHSGTGLGLAITHSLVNMMKGEIVVHSDVGQGSTFRVVLPREVKRAKKKATSKVTGQEKKPALNASNKKVSSSLRQQAQ